MVKRIALDSNTAIAVLNGDTEAIKTVASFDVICLPVTVCGELIFGAKNSKLSVKNEARYFAFIESCEILDINIAVSETYGEIRLALKKKGKPIPENDIWIAATCIANSTRLFTYDKHFHFVRELDLI
jgi:tRNA(fMet)-specific endonuclease VapC